MGLFSKWQPLYAEYGIATFPVTEKIPAVRNFLRIGLPASRDLILKFSQYDAFGFACRASKITVVDIDTTDERVLADALALFGPTPLLIRSASRHFQAWYRHNGERRLVKPFSGQPIDILGDGHVVAPPSETAKGAYSFLAGQLADVCHLPQIRAGALEEMLAARSEVSAETACISRVKVGHRNDALWRECMRCAATCADIDHLMTFANRKNRVMLSEPLPENEVRRLVASAWRIQTSGRNKFGRGRFIAFAEEQFDRLASHPDAFFLLGHLKRRHWGSPTFFVANAMANSIGLSLRRFQQARSTLESLGEIQKIRPASRASGAALYQFKVFKFEHQ